jgi:anti-sigma regulatory factor (Ser/Thr protein kinase)/CHASE3 domain sensor protein
VRAHEATARRAFLPPLLLLGALTILLLGLVGNLLDAMRSVDHSDQVIAQSEATLAILVDMESGQRDYLVSGDRDYLTPYRQGKAQAPKAFARLAVLVQDTTGQRMRVAKMLAEYARWHALADRDAALRAGGSQSALGPFVVATQEREIDALRSRFGAVLASEHELRNRRLEAARAAVDLALACGAVATLFAGSTLTTTTLRRLRLLSNEFAAVLQHERLTAEDAAQRQRTLIREVLFALTDGRLRLCGAVQELPVALPALSDDIALTHPTLSAFRDAVRAAIRRAGIAEERGHDLEMAAGEAAMNAVVHAGTGIGSVHADLERGTVQIRVTDAGPGIREDAIHRATLERGYSSAGSLGHGFWMMLSTCDRVYLSTSSAGTHVVLEQDCAEPVPVWMAEPRVPVSPFVLT